VVLTTKGLVVVPLLVRVGLIQLVLHAQMMRMLAEMMVRVMAEVMMMIMMMMSDHCLQR